MRFDAMVRVAGTDPGTSSLDVLILEDGTVVDQARFAPAQLEADAEVPTRWLLDRRPFDLVAGPSGYGLPLKAAADCSAGDLNLLALVRPDERGQSQGVAKFMAVVRSLAESSLPVVFLPSVIQLPTVPSHRKTNRIDMGTADKLCVAALALAQYPDLAEGTFCLVELGSAFTACLVMSRGHVVDGLGGTSGPCGWRSAGAWDGEVAYLLSPLAKRDLFAGGVLSIADRAAALVCFRESLLRAVASLHAVTPCEHIILSGRLLLDEKQLAEAIEGDLGRVAAVSALQSLPGAWVKHAAQGAAVLADGLAGGHYGPLVERLALRDSAGSVLDWLQHPRVTDLRLR
jgi:predicted butyrate kinase (DUF1464 family)